jgi:hypothetical protein
MPLMSKIYYVSDFFVDEIVGGAELVDDNIIRYLTKYFDVERIKSQNIVPDTKKFYILSNISLMKPEYVNWFSQRMAKYIIVEHDYKIHHTRQPWRFKDCIVPKAERINYDLYRNALLVYVQTDDHLGIYQKNEVAGKFQSLDCSIWSNKELSLLESNISHLKTKNKFAIVASDNWIKNTQGALNLCLGNKWDYEFIPKLPYDKFLPLLAEYPALVFLPIARESCCRLMVEARCLGLNVITNQNSGAFNSSWFKKSGKELIEYLRKRSEENLYNIMYEIKSTGH